MELNLADLFELIADNAPERIAVVSGDEQLTYGELDERSTRLANHLREVGIGRDDHIGIYAHNRPDWIVTMLAAFKLRAVPINVNFRYVESELAYVLDNADVKAVVHDAALSPTVEAILDRVPSLQHRVAIPDGSDLAADGTVGIESAIESASAERDFGARSADDHYILYTGGTTGNPKGTVWRHQDILYAALQGGRPLGEPLQEADEVLGNLEHPPGSFMVTAPLMHAGGQWAALIGLLTGGKVVLSPPRGFDPHVIWSIVEREGVQILNLIGDAMARPLAEALAEDPTRYDVSSLFVLSSGGAVLSPVVKRQLAELLPGVMIVDGFGASETGDNGRAMSQDEDGKARFTINAYTAVLDDDHKPVAPGSGEIGRLAKCGPIPIGYYKDPDKTAETFVEVDGKRWVIPGDYATVDADGTVTVLGRGSVSINTGGEKVYPEEVESVVKAHPAVWDAMVIGTPSERWGEEVTALARLRPGHELTIDDLAEHCRTHLAGFKIPRRLVIVDEIPRTASEKPDYRAAKELVGRSGDGVHEIA